MQVGAVRPGQVRPGAQPAGQVRQRQVRAEGLPAVRQGPPRRPRGARGTATPAAGRRRDEAVTPAKRGRCRRRRRLREDPEDSPRPQRRHRRCGERVSEQRLSPPTRRPVLLQRQKAAEEADASSSGERPARRGAGARASPPGPPGAGGSGAGRPPAAGRRRGGASRGAGRATEAEAAGEGARASNGGRPTGGAGLPAVQRERRHAVRLVRGCGEAPEGRIHAEDGREGQPGGGDEMDLKTEAPRKVKNMRPRWEVRRTDWRVVAAYFEGTTLSASKSGSSGATRSCS